MDVFRRIVFVAALSGLIVGGLVSVAHHFGTAALIARAEVLERAADTERAMAGPAMAGPAMAGPAMAGMDHGGVAAWEPADGLERTAFTALADVLTSVAFAMALGAAYVLHGGAIGWRRGIAWGFGGFLAFTLAPSLGLPPQVPGTEAAPLAARQLWWVATAGLAAVALYLLAFRRRPVWIALAAALLVLPHLVGAPRLAEAHSTAPESLARLFVTAALATSLLFWLVLGGATGALFQAMSVRERG